MALGYQTVDGVVLPDVRYVASQQQTEHITLPGLFTFSDGSADYATSIPQVLISGDLTSLTAQFGVGTISFEALGQTVQLGMIYIYKLYIEATNCLTCVDNR